jgi:uncharacterized protein (DUF302 family)
MGVSLSATLRTSFDDVVLRTRKALAQNGFGVLTEAVSRLRPIGVLLPCNVVVRSDPNADG